MDWWTCLWVIAQHELPIAEVSEQRPVGAQSGPSARLDRRSPECLLFPIQTKPLVSMETFSKVGDGPWSGKGTGQQKRAGYGEGAQSAWATLQGSTTLTEADKVISFWCHTGQLVRGKGKLRTSPSPKHLLQLQGHTHHRCAHLYAQTQSCSCVFKHQPSYACSHSYSHSNHMCSYLTHM